MFLTALRRMRRLALSLSRPIERQAKGGGSVLRARIPAPRGHLRILKAVKQSAYRTLATSSSPPADAWLARAGINARPRAAALIRSCWTYRISKNKSISLAALRGREVEPPALSHPNFSSSHDRTHRRRGVDAAPTCCTTTRKRCFVRQHRA